MQFDAKKLVNGTTIQYVLQLSQRPANPEKLWRGKITATFIHSDSIGAVQVDSLEAGYEGCIELVHLYQIRVIESNA
jgi:hypothetical protein